MNKMREQFEKWISSPPYERRTQKFGNRQKMWPEQYEVYEVQLAWEAYQAGVRHLIEEKLFNEE